MRMVKERKNKGGPNEIGEELRNNNRKRKGRLK
jgi:hypothetical protein